jgi:serine O-acetyltransferase
LTRIGNNCTLSQFTTIGSNHNTPAVIGDNVYIGPGVCLVENVSIGDNAVIGAGSVVVKSVPANCTFAGNPARLISQKHNDPKDPNIWLTSS